MNIRKMNDHGPYAVDITYVDGKIYTYEFEKMRAEAATDLLIDILSVVGDGLGALTSMATSKTTLLDLDLTSTPIENVCKKLTQGLTRDRALTKRIIKQLTSGPKVICNGVSVNYDTFYEDKLPLSFFAMRANLEVQFGSFLDAAAGLLPQGPSTAAKADPTQS